MPRPSRPTAKRPDFSRETAVGGMVAGIDEVGRGPWAGPVVAAAVVLSPDIAAAPQLAAFNDSKTLSPSAREECVAALHEARNAGAAWFALGRAEVAEIDALNILQATMLAMHRAVAALAVPPDYALVDGNRLPDLPCAGETLVKGDSRSLSIAAASLVAKVARDAMMAELAETHPGYGWERNAGYGTAEHQRALQEFGVTPHHRRSFAPIRKLLETST